MKLFDHRYSCMTTKCSILRIHIEQQQDATNSCLIMIKQQALIWIFLPFPIKIKGQVK